MWDLRGNWENNSEVNKKTRGGEKKKRKGGGKKKMWISQGKPRNFKAKE